MAADFAKTREQLIAEIEAEMHTLRDIFGKAKLDTSVVRALLNVPRHEFVPDDMQGSAYLNRPLSIGYGQTISQPFVVAAMTDMLALGSAALVLEVGTGSGYQTAVLAELAAAVFSVEVVPELAESADRSLKRLGYDNVRVRNSDGWRGWPEHAPYDAIIVTAAAPEIPEALIDQLKPGGRLVIPIGAPGRTQFLTLVEKDVEGKVTVHEGLPVAFVPLIKSS
jgi:protein-L-isoaspartate(D-aspartate) O-methyltransferase